jgi:hypothetical protein
MISLVCLKGNGVKQQGFLTLIMSFLLVSSVTVLMYFDWKSFRLDLHWSPYLERDLQLELSKDRLLNFALLHSEIYLTNTAGELIDPMDQVSIGYLPCPDFNGDGWLLGSETSCQPEVGEFFIGQISSSSCHANCMGWLPSQIRSRHLYFGPEKRFYYVLHPALSYLNYQYSQDRFTPLTPDTLGTLINQNSLEVDGKSGFVMVLIDAGEDGLSTFHQTHDARFQNQLSTQASAHDADRVVGLHIEDWTQQMIQKICHYKQLPHNLSAWQKWFEEC